MHLVGFGRTAVKLEADLQYPFTLKVLSHEKGLDFLPSPPFPLVQDIFNHSKWSRDGLCVQESTITITVAEELLIKPWTNNIFMVKPTTVTQQQVFC